MNYETIDGVQLPKIGFGTWRIGGRSSPDHGQDARALAAMRSAIELGYTHFDTAEGYAAGHAEELLGRAIRETGTPRESLFITSKVAPENLRYKDVRKACEGSLHRLGTGYLDMYLIHWPHPGMQLADTFRGLNQLVREGKLRHLGVSNFDLKLLKKSRELSETPLITDQVPYNLTDRTYAKNGVLGYCQENDILLTAYTPVKLSGLESNATVRAIARAHSATPQQIAIAWLVAQSRVITIPMSQDALHQKQNLEAGSIALTPDEMARLTG